MTVALIVLLVLAGLVFILFELLTPTFGPLAALGLAAEIAAIWLGFTLSPALGVILIAAVAVGLPIYVALLVRMLPRLPGSRKLFLGRQPSGAAQGTPEASNLASLVGRTGTAETILRPSGAVRIAGQRVIAVAEHGVIEAGQSVEVIASDGMNVIVRKVETA